MSREVSILLAQHDVRAESSGDFKGFDLLQEVLGLGIRGEVFLHGLQDGVEGHRERVLQILWVNGTALIVRAQLLEMRVCPADATQMLQEA